MRPPPPSRPPPCPRQPWRRAWPPWEAALEPDTERLLRAGGEQGLAPPGSGIGRPTLERWLRAEKGNAASAAARLNAHAKWRAEYVSVRRKEESGVCGALLPRTRAQRRHAGGT